MTDKPLVGFWRWFAQGIDGRPGYARLVNWWLVAHFAFGLLGALVVSQPLEEVSKNALLPVMAIFVGLTFSWAGNAHALLQSPEILRFAANSDGGIEDYIFSFQLGILVLLVTIAFWMIPPLRISYPVRDGFGFQAFNFSSKWLLYSLLALSLRSSWHAVLGANMLLLVRAKLLGR